MFHADVTAPVLVKHWCSMTQILRKVEKKTISIPAGQSDILNIGAAGHRYDKKNQYIISNMYNHINKVSI